MNQERENNANWILIPQVKNKSDLLLHDLWRVFNFDLRFSMIIYIYFFFPNAHPPLRTFCLLSIILICCHSDEWKSASMLTTSCCCFNASESFLLSIHLCSVVEKEIESNFLLPFKMFPSPATKEPSCVTCVEASVHPLPTLSKRQKKKERTIEKTKNEAEAVTFSNVTLWCWMIVMTFCGGLWNMNLLGYFLMSLSRPDWASVSLG